MNRSFVIAVFLLNLAAFSGCRAPSRSFGRHPSARALAIPVFTGTPPVIYTHRKLGTVAGEVGFASSPGEGTYRAIFNLAQKALDKGANAVIALTGGPTERGYRFEGEAVAFDVMPPDDVPAPLLPRDPERGD